MEGITGPRNTRIQITEEERYDQFVLSTHDTIRQETPMIDGEIRCWNCGEEQKLSPNGYFMCKAPKFPCRMKGVIQKMCNECNDVNPVEWRHKHCDDCGLCYDDIDPCDCRSS